MKFAHKLTLALLVVLAVVLSLCNTVLIGQQFRQELHTAQETLSADWQRESRAMQRTLVTPGSGSLAARVGSYLQAITEQNSLACAAYSVDGTSLYYALPTAVPLSEVEALLAQDGEPEPELGGTPRDYMGKVLAYCQRYANSFTPESRGLMFIGSAGLGKTHMALAIADTVLNRGFDVLYTSSAALAAQLGREHFDRAAEDPWLDACKEADLLILDDLGTEYISQLTISVLYELINTRMLCHRPTIYTSNIVDSSIFEARYTEKVASRILGSCQIFKFFGTDQRLKRGGKR